MSPSDTVSTLARATGTRAPATASRVRILAQIAEHYTNLVDPLNGPGDVRGTGELPGLMPATYTPTVREFERLRRLMREDHSSPLVDVDGIKVSVRRLHWHLTEWHIAAQRVIHWKPVTAKRHGKRVTLIDRDGNMVKRPEPRLLRHPQAKEHLAEAAIRWIAEHWGLPHEPMLPAALLDERNAA